MMAFIRLASQGLESIKSAPEWFERVGMSEKLRIKNRGREGGREGEREREEEEEPRTHELEV